MKRDARAVRAGRTSVEILASLICLATASAACAQVAPPQPAQAEPGFVLLVGADVILKSSEIPLLEDGHWIPTQNHLLFRVERLESDKARLVSRDNTIRGWVSGEQVVPLEPAHRYLAGVLAKDRRNTDAYWTRARLWLYHNEPDRALANLELAIRLQPDQPRFYITRGLVYLQSKRFDQAIADCDRAISLDPHSGRAYAVRALARLQRNEGPLSQADLTQALALDDIDPVRFTSQPAAGQTAPTADGKSRALDDPDEAQREDLPEPKSAAQFLARGNARFAASRYDDAIADYTAAIRIDPTCSPAFAARAQSWAMKHYREREIADYNEAIKLDPKNTGYRVARANSWSAQGMHDEALADFNEALRMEPNSAPIWVARGKEWQRDYKIQNAIADFSRALQLDPRYTPASINRGTAWKLSGAFDRAIQEFAHLAGIDPDNALAHQTLARILATCHEAKYRDGRRAVQEATRACELTRWGDPDSLDTLAAACAEVGDFDSAVKWQTRAIGLVRQDVPTHLRGPMDLGLRRGISFEDRLAFYKSKKPTRE
jgi:tetratricopeptide (TPR) repeat protein